jgi:hypothetical protein
MSSWEQADIWPIRLIEKVKQATGKYSSLQIQG